MKEKTLSRNLITRIIFCETVQHLEQLDYNFCQKEKSNKIPCKQISWKFP
jgi:hypothetical protein